MVLSILPFVSIYPILKIKKFWIMTLINILIGFVLFLGIIFMVSDVSLPYPLPSLTVLISYIALWAVQPILVYRWSKQYNERLEDATAVNA